MKKTRKTMLTSVLLSAAVVLHSEAATVNSITENKAEELSVLYGPPNVLYRYIRGDLNDDDKIDIVDYILMKARFENPDGSVGIGYADDEFMSDLDEDLRLTENDLKIFERYLFGKIPSVRGEVYPDDYDDNPENLGDEQEQPVYGTMPVTQPVYGVITAVPDKEPSVTEDEPEVSDEISDVPQTVYGPPTAY